ncbi:flagellar basal-body rod protein [Buchnera aphidicola (Cinara tujafilina)]|uniref:Flagellar basal-body rod protein n=1 Tax=Buchnera aphidicola (Cinara tujafilina) TaxID=261317 RepID=F7WZE2_9GAMM|nr:flagellar basal body rod protein [Buchnera aphidicola]AEH39804.1 flagellar basal-body rod protein [Buchnera aphidicola (Cinara tujafilina)]
MNKIINSMLKSINHNLTEQKMLLNNIANSSTPNFKSNLFYDKTPNPSIDNPTTNERYNDPDKQEELVNEDIELLFDTMMHKNNFFSAIDEKGKEVFIKTNLNEPIKLNQKRELVIDKFRLLDTDNNIIIIKNGYNAVIQPDYTIIVSKDNDESKKSILLSKVKSIYLEDTDVVQRKNSKFCDLNQSGLEKYKENESEILIGNMPYHVNNESDVNLTENLIKTLSDVRHIKASIKVVSRANKNEERANVLLNGGM